MTASIWSSSTSTTIPIDEKIRRALSRSSSVVRVPRAIAVAAWQTAAGVFVIARMKRASPFSSMLATRTPAAREMTNFPLVAAAIPATTSDTTPGFTPIKITSAYSATSAFSAVTRIPSSSRSAVRAASFGSLTRISPGAQNFARTSPRMTDPASLPPPMKPSRYRQSLDCKLMGWADIKRW